MSIRRLVFPVLIALLALPVTASALPFMPSFGQSQSAPRQAAAQAPDLYQLAPVPPLIAVLLRSPQTFQLSPAQKNRIMVAAHRDARWMASIEQGNRTLHEDILNGISGEPLRQAETAVSREQGQMLARSVAVDEIIRETLSAAQWNTLIQGYRNLEANPRLGE